jgi:fibronectin-binding autotransporter adhesin
VLARNEGGGLTKIGNGVLTLGGENDYTGVTIVKHGGLRVDGHLAGPVEVAPGASLGGGGSISASVEIAPGSTFLPEPGSIMTVRGNASIRGKFLIEITPAGAGRLDVSDELDLTGASLVMNPTASRPGSPFHVIANYGTLRGRFADDEALPAGYAIDYRYKGKNQIALVATADNSDGE